MKYKKTKIVATISDARCDVSLIQKLYDEGMNVVRLNTAHQGPEGMKRVIDNVREVSSTSLCWWIRKDLKCAQRFVTTPSHSKLAKQ